MNTSNFMNFGLEKSFLDFELGNLSLTYLKIITLVIMAIFQFA